MSRYRLSRVGSFTHLLAFITCFALVFFLLGIGPPSLAANGHSELTQGQSSKPASPEDVTRQFYAWYFGAHFPNPGRSNMASFRKYVTQGFLKRATARNVDSMLFIDAQDIDETWADNFTVSKATIRGQSATVEVALNGKEMKYNLSVTLRRERGVWKIDNVKGHDS